MRFTKSFWHQRLAGFDPWAHTGGARFCVSVAKWAISFFEDCLTFTTGRWAGQPFTLQPWQAQLIGHLFGWLNPDGSRRFRSLFVYIPRKNGKSELAAGLSVIMFVGDGEKTAEVYVGALTTNQANILFTKAKRMIRNSTALSERVSIPKGRTSRTLYDETTDSHLQILASSEESAQGFNPSCGVVDELHTQRDGGFSGALREGMGSRLQPLLVELTTAADSGENYCNSQLEYAELVRDGKICDPTFFPVVFRAAEGDDPGDPATWRKCNPNFGVTEPETFYAAEWRKMSRTKSGVARFKKYYLNWQTVRNDSWLPQELYDATEVAEPENLAQTPCVAAIDRAIVHDICPVGLYFPSLGYFCCAYIVPRETAESNIVYGEWAKAGFIRVSESTAISDDELVELVADLKAQFPLIERVAYDPWRMASVAARIEKDLRVEATAVQQSFRELTAPINALEIAIRGGKWTHPADPVLSWMFRNCRVERDHKDNIKIVKENPMSPKKIDGIIAAVMALKASQSEEKRARIEAGGVLYVD